MLKVCCVWMCVILTLPALAQKSSIELFLKIDSSGGISTNKEDEKKIVYPTYETGMALLDAYSEAWKNEDYPLLYHLLSISAQEEWSFSKFKRLLREDKETNGGLQEFSTCTEIGDNGSEKSWSVVLVYKRSSARSKTVRALLVEEKGGWFVKEGGLLPPDYSMFDR